MPLSVLNVDDDHEVAQELRDKLDAIGFYQKIFRLPVVDIRGVVLPVPSIKDVDRRLRSLAAADALRDAD